MNDKQKRKAVNEYQFVVYSPQDKPSKQTEPHVWEITGHSYPYQEGEFDVRWLEAFTPPPPRRHKKRRR